MSGPGRDGGAPAVPAYYVHRPIRVTSAREAPDIPAYLYFGGIAGASAGLAALAELTGDRRLTTTSRYAAAGCAAAAVAALVRDHRRPERFLSGLRAPDPSFPLSLGTWLTLPFAGLATIAAAAELAGLRTVATVAGAAAGVLGPAVCTYTAVTLVDTEVPAWHEAYRELPFLFAGSSISGAAGIGLFATLGTDPVPARRLALAGAAMELAAALRLRAAPSSLSVPFRSGPAGWMLTRAAALTALGAGATLLGRDRFGRTGRWAAIGGGAALLVSGAMNRLGVYHAGRQSAR
ncbi:polysulfide reductase NrfD [Cryptosporangium aurantiacum]|uniref:Polysulphide reductase, NrfD n=1 Tax=Cryptosporangium aurantiacum TaxID=134849 RepID=A0A1M7NG56_9ACTN|nr:polysulfide reductase NrfD [Cryptosporangium aurantiacum]SHN02232.1 Polysulphide reductase, NrfD [Cryptosporangium aurantiacum]